MASRHESGTVERALVSVVDDDESVRESLPDLLNELGFEARVFSSAAEFLSSGSVSQSDCLILDIAMPNMTGLELQRELRLRGFHLPVIFITAHKDESARATAFEQGAVGFLLKPFSDTDLFGVIKLALGMN